jgi:hypothetical protein
MIKLKGLGISLEWVGCLPREQGEVSGSETHIPAVVEDIVRVTYDSGGTNSRRVG